MDQSVQLRVFNIEKMEEKTKKVSRKTVQIKKAELTRKEPSKSHYNKFQIWVAKKLKLVLQDHNRYLYRIQYTGSTRLKPDDIVFSTQGVMFIVVKEENRLAMILSENAMPERPAVYGTLTILEKSENEAILNS